MNHYSIIHVQYPTASDLYFDAAHTKTHHPSHISLHMHDYYEFYIYLRGNIKFLLDNQIYDVKKGEIIIIPPYHMHSLIVINNDEPYERMYLYATKNVLSSLPFNQYSFTISLSDIAKTKKYFYNINDPNDFETILSIIDYMHNNKPLNFYNKETINKSCLTLLISIISKYRKDENITHRLSEMDTLFSKATEYINKHFTENLSIDFLCATLFTNRQTLSKIFKNHTNLTLHNYITSLRISRAKQLIADGEKPSKIYSLCGFNDYTTFYRTFKKIENSTPQMFEAIISGNASDSISSSSLNDKGVTHDNLKQESEDTSNLTSIPNYYYVNSYLKKHLDDFLNGSSYVIQFLKNDLFNYPAYMNKYVAPCYIPVLNTSDDSTYFMNSNIEAKKTYYLIIPTANTFFITLVGNALDHSTIKISIQNKQVSQLYWYTSNDSISTKKALYLSKGILKLDIELMSGCVKLTDIYIDLAPNPSKCDVNITTSSTAHGTSSSNISDDSATTIWKPASYDTSPWIEFMFSQILYFDCFSIVGNTSHIQSFIIQTSINDDNWITVYEGNELISEKVIYIQGTSAIKGNRFRILFTQLNGPLEIIHMELPPYINWALEDKNTSITSTYDINNDLHTIINGNRIYPGWITTGGQIITLIFDKPHKIDTITIVGIQESVKNGEEGVIPDHDMTSRFVQRQYTLSYLDPSNQWIQSAIYITMIDGENTELLRKVLNKFVLEKPVVTTAIRVKIETSYWVRVIEVEVVESFEF